MPSATVTSQASSELNHSFLWANVNCYHCKTEQNQSKYGSGSYVAPSPSSWGHSEFTNLLLSSHSNRGPLDRLIQQFSEPLSGPIMCTQWWKAARCGRWSGGHLSALWGHRHTPTRSRVNAARVERRGRLVCTSFWDCAEAAKAKMIKKENTCVDKSEAGMDGQKQNIACRRTVTRRKERMLVEANTEASLRPNRLINLGPFHNGGNDPLRITLTDVEGGRSIW